MSADFAILKGKSLGKTVRFVPFGAGSSAVEQEPFKLLVVGSNPTRLTEKSLMLLHRGFFNDLMRFVPNLKRSAMLDAKRSMYHPAHFFTDRRYSFVNDKTICVMRDPRNHFVKLFNFSSSMFLTTISQISSTSLQSTKIDSRSIPSLSLAT